MRSFLPFKEDVRLRPNFFDSVGKSEDEAFAFAWEAEEEEAEAEAEADGEDNGILSFVFSSFFNKADKKL